VPRHLSLILLAVLAGAVLVPDAGAARRTVSTEAGFHAAVEQMGASGGIITLRAGRYEYLRVGPRAGRWLTIRARPRAVTRYVEVHGARRVKLVDLDVVTFKGRHALLDIDRSRQVNVLRARVRGRNGLRARVSVTSSRGVAVRDSTFRRTRWVSLRSIGSSRVTVEGNRFVDCYGCDFLLVKATNDLVVRGNTFDRALPGLCGVEGSCNHQDLAQMTGGRRWLIEGNRFGVAYNGAAQLYITGYGPTDDVVIRGNTFLRDDPLAPGFAPWTGVVIGQPTGWLGCRGTCGSRATRSFRGIRALTATGSAWRTRSSSRSSTQPCRRGSGPSLPGTCWRQRRTPSSCAGSLGRRPATSPNPATLSATRRV
jgi:hypothetical protein